MSRPFSLRVVAWTLWAVVGAGAVAPACAEPDVPLPEVLDLEQAAALLRAGPTLVRLMAEAGRLPGRRIGNTWRFSHSRLIEWLGGRDLTATVGQAPEARAAVSVESPADPPTRERVDAASPSVPVQASSPAPVPPTVGERPLPPTAADVALRNQRLLLSPGAGSLDFKLAYGHATSELVSVLRQDRRSLDATASLSYGLTDAHQVVVRVPGTWQRTTTSSSAGAPSSSGIVSDHYASDASMSLLGVALHEGVGRPNLIWSIDAVLPTGPGDRGLGASLVMSKTYDPAVVFASLSYLVGQRPDLSAPRRSLARNNFGFNVGYTYALNDSLAMSTALVTSWRDYRSVDASTLSPPREREDLQFGLTVQLARGLFAEPGVSVRLGSGGSDFGASLNLSYSY